MKISYCICAHNEALELERLLRFLKEHIRKEDEVIIQLDSTYTKEVLEVCNLFTNFNHEGDVKSQAIPNSKFYSYPLDGDFARFKNYLTSQCSGDYLFQIDADEVPHTDLIKILPMLLEQNSEVDLFLVPRINTVDGITQEHIQKWRWNVNEKKWVNFPDYQTRIFRRASEIFWVGKVHEKITGTKTFSPLPAEEVWCLYHPKSISRQEVQNKFYETI